MQKWLNHYSLFDNASQSKCHVLHILSFLWKRDAMLHSIARAHICAHLHVCVCACVCVYRLDDVHEITIRKFVNAPLHRVCRMQCACAYCLLLWCNAIICCILSIKLLRSLACQQPTHLNSKCNMQFCNSVQDNRCLSVCTEQLRVFESQVNKLKRI